MTPLKIGKSLLAAALIAPAPALAANSETKLSVTTTPNPVSEKESVQLQIVVDAPLATTVPEPTFDAPDFAQTGARDMRFQSYSDEFGPNTRKKLIFTYVLMPRQEGNFLVRNIQTKVAGQTISSPDVRIKVVADSSAPSSSHFAQGTQNNREDEEDSSNPAAPGYSSGGRPAAPAPSEKSGVSPSVPDRFNSDFTVWASPSKSRAYVGEPIVVEYFIYDFGGLRQTEVLQWPTFTGFWKEDLELRTQVTFEELYLKQQELRRAFIARYAVYGIKPGKFSLDKLGIRGKYAPSNALTPGIIFGYDLRTGQHYSQDLNVEILPLPEAGRPANYGGAVGNFRLKLETDKASVAQNTPITFTFTLEGIGNFQAIDSIKLNLPPDFELYETTVNGRKTAPIGVRQELASKKTFQTVAIPRKAGKFEIPSVNWSFFNTEKESFETLTTPPFSLEVTPNESGNTASNTYMAPKGASTDEKKQVEEFRYLKPLDLSVTPSTQPWLSWALWLLFAANFALAWRWLRGRTRKFMRLVKGVDPFSEARIALLQAKGIRDGNWQAGLEEVIFIAIQVLLQTNPRGLPRADLEDAWKTRGLPAPLFQKMISLLNEIDRHRFSSQKLSGSNTHEVRSRFTKETERFLIEASNLPKK